MATILSKNHEDGIANRTFADENDLSGGIPSEIQTMRSLRDIDLCKFQTRVTRVLFVGY